MASFNKITIVGNLGRDPVLRYTPQGTAVCDFSVATTERRGGAGGEEITTWFKVTVWNKQAEVVNQYLSKGRQVYVEGRLRLEEYQDREGQKRTQLAVTATDIQFLSSRGSEEGMGAGAGGGARAAAPRGGERGGDMMHDAAPTDDDIPF